MMDDLSGQVIKGYELRERIGAGGFGAVYRATQNAVGREVAVKIILPSFASQPDFVRRFENEAQLIARLEHLHIVPLYDYWRDPNGAYLVMRWLRGGSLRDALERSGAYTLEDTALLLDQIAGALVVAHRHNVIHRDLKPGNILLDEDGHAYLADFGIAKDITTNSASTTQADVILGSPEYLAPEQARSEAVTPQTDIYSLGVVLFEMLSGEHPFPNLSAVEKLFKHLNEPLPQITNLPADALDAVNAVIQKATAKNPQHRFSDVLALASAFREACVVGSKISTSNLVEVLTRREQEILQALIEGRSNKEIAGQLFVTVATVKWYITQIYRKMGVRSRVQAIVRARELNLISRLAQPDDAEADVGTLLATDFSKKVENPYKGLRPFESSDSQDFFGRDKLVSRMSKRLGERDEFARFLVVVGPSGSGKSSAVKAGLIPALWRGDVPGAEKWFIAEMTPGSRPLDELEVALLRLCTHATVNLREHLVRDEFGLLRAAHLALPNENSEMLLVIDQFEEIFTLVEDEAVRRHFLRLLYAAVTAPRSRIRVVITLRADFYDRPLHYPDFGDLVRNRLETVLPLSAKELERAIVAPAERVGIMFETGLVEAIIEEVFYQPGGLPLLQYALTELFEARQGALLTMSAYQQVGGAVKALAKHAESLFTEFSAEAQAAIHQMFMRLVTVGDGVEDTRRRALRSELLALGTDEDVMDEVIDTYTNYRLLSVDRDPVTHSPTVEIAHEAILHAWERLRVWLDEGRADIRLHRQLSSAVDDWLTNGREVSFLLRGTRLSQYEDWVSTTTLALTPDERAFVRAGIAHRVQEVAAEQARQAREIRLERRSQSFLRGLVVVLVLATLGAFGLTTAALNERNTAERNAELSQSLALASAAQSALVQRNTDQALALAVAANQISQPPTFAQRILYDASIASGTLRRLPCAVDWCWGVGISPDEKTVLTSDGAGGIILSDLATGTVVHRYEGGHHEEANAEFLPSGVQFLSAGYDDKMLLWDVTSGEILRTYAGSDGDMNGLAISPDGTLAANGTEKGTVLVWDVQSGELLHRLVGHDPTVQVQGVAFSPDGHTLLSASEDHTMILWDVQTGALIRRFEGHTNIVFSVQFSPDGRSALSTSFDNTMILWDVATGQMVRQFVGHTNWVFDAQFSPDGTRILSASRDQRLMLWDVATGGILQTYVGEPGMALSATFLHDGTQALVSYNNGMMRLWQLDSQALNGQFGGVSLPVSETDTTFADGDILAVSRDGRSVATAGAGAEARAVQLWDIERGTLIRRFTGHTDNVTSIAFSPDQEQIAAAAWDGVVILWDVATGQEVRRFSDDKSAILDMAFNAEGSQIATASEGRKIVLWGTANGQEVRRWDGFSDSVNTVAFSPDGDALLAGFGTFRYVAGLNEDNSLRLFDVATGAEIRRFEGHTAPVTDVRFSPDGTMILSSSTDATLRLWDVSSGEERHRFIGHTTAIWNVNISPDGRYAASGAQDGATMIWDLTTGALLRSLGEQSAMVQGVSFSAGDDFALTASSDGVVRLWRLSLDLSDLLSWAHSHRYVRDLACSERELYRVLPLCNPE